MKRDTLAAVLLALLAVVALGVAAATLDSAVSLGGGGLGGTGDGGGPSGESGDVGASPAPSGGGALSVPPACFEFLREPPALLAFAAVLTGVAAFVYRDTGSRLAAGAVAGSMGVPVAALGWLLSACRPVDGEIEFALGAAVGEGGFLPQGGGGAGAGGGEGTASAPELLFALVVVAALVASVAVLLGAGGDDEPADGEGHAESEESDPADPDLREVGRTAGAAAERIERSDADNEVYRAWRDMTEALDVDRPASSTPAEFAAAAVDAGVDEEPVADLTAVFERVRYGGEDATAERERRAAEALRRIEERHGGAG
ncbi:DUF4129 domain-containing protein [Halorubrum depositum]|uniref:DUF4129 domain-containing protein n=1 Tax=Halorubrum depositum TaxID=2583992 RepID=UPI0011A36A5A|nr:DUF4129 domain-containing protein [Halorubrum depositum]